MTYRLFLLVVTLIVLSPAQASLITFGFTGKITGSEFVEGPNKGLPLPGAPVRGSAIRGEYTFDPNTVDSAHTGNYGSLASSYGTYLNSIQSFWVDFGGLHYAFDLNSGGFANIDTENWVGSVHRDRYSFVIGNGSSLGIPGPLIGDFLAYNFVFGMQDFEGGPDPDLLSSDVLPLTPPDISLTSDFLNLGSDELNYIQMTYQDQNTLIRSKVRGEILSLYTVPIPATLWLFICGLAVLFRQQQRVVYGLSSLSVPAKRYCQLIASRCT